MDHRRSGGHGERRGRLAEELFDIGLGEDAEDGAPVGGVVDVGAGKELVGDAVHLFVGQELTVRDSGSTGQRKGEALMGLNTKRTKMITYILSSFL